MSAAATDVLLSIELSMRGEWNDVERLRESVWNCITAAIGTCEQRDAIAMVTAELLENAVKHADPPSSRLSVRITNDSGIVRVESSATPLAAERVIELLAWIRGFASSEEAYVAKLLEVAAAPTNDGSCGGLGFARIAYEGGCTLSASRNGSVLAITAQMPFSR